VDKISWKGNTTVLIADHLDDKKTILKPSLLLLTQKQHFTCSIPIRTTVFIPNRLSHILLAPVYIEYMKPMM